MSEPQLERSVLEAKEREELFAIAEALGTRPTTRARKGDLVTTILRATGVEVVDEPAPVRRTRAKKAAPVVDAGPLLDDGTVIDDVSGAGVSGSAAPVQTTHDLAASPESVSSAAAGDPGSIEVVGAPDSSAAGPSAPDPSAAALSGTPQSPAIASTDRVRPANPGGRMSNRPPSAPRGQGDGQLSMDDASPASGAGEPFRRNPRSGASTPSGLRPGSGSTPAGSPSSGGSQSGGSSSGGSPSGSFPSAGASSPGLPAGGSSAGSTPRAGTERTPDQVTVEGGSDQPGPDGADRPRFDGEGSNRRNRRRRGRERGERVERELPGQGGGEVAYTGEPVAVAGYLDLRDEGYGFLRTQGYAPSAADVYVSISQVRRFALRKGDHLEGAARPAAATEKYPALLRIDTISGMTPDDARNRARFEDGVPVSPDEMISLATEPGAAVALRLIDLLAPIGKGQRGLLTGPPKSGKTTILTQVIAALEDGHPDLDLFVVVVDERPEDVTELTRAVRTEVIATTFDRPADEHIGVAELVMERAKRLVEAGRDVVVVLDGLTRLARAYNLAPSGTGRVLPGGIEAGALHHPKRFFAAARNIEGGGSLTMLATALVETGSRTDDVIYEELDGTANMELRLSGRLAGRRIYPAIDVSRSATRHEERLFDSDTLDKVWLLRRAYDPDGVGGAEAGVEAFLERLVATKTNQEFLTETARNAASGA